MLLKKGGAGCRYKHASADLQIAVFVASDYSFEPYPLPDIRPWNNCNLGGSKYKMCALIKFGKHGILGLLLAFRSSFLRIPTLKSALKKRKEQRVATFTKVVRDQQ